MTRSAQTDAQLLEASLAGGADAFGALVERYHGLVCAVSFSATGDRALSEDVAQDTFVAAWRSLKDLREPDKLRSWLCGIARNLGHKALRRTGREIPSDTEVQAALGALEHTAPTPLDDALDRESEHLVWTVLARMPETYREPMVLFYREDQSAKQVAEALGVSENAVHQRLARGRQYLKQGVTDVVERTLQRTKPAPTFVAGVLAAIGLGSAGATGTAHAATVPSPTATSAGTVGAILGAITMKKLLIAAAAAALLLLAATRGRDLFADDAGARAPHPLAATAVESERATPGAPAPPHLPPPVRTEPRPGTAGAPTGDRGGGPTASFELTVAGPELASVALDGGRSSVTTFGPPDDAPAFARAIRGRVVDSDGRPVAGAVVLVGRHLHQQWSSLIGDQGAVADESGAFTIVTHSPDELSAIAVHRDAGWSASSPVPAGDADATIEIRIAATGAVEGVITRAGEPTQAVVKLVPSDGSLTLTTETEPDGAFRYPQLPPGQYRLGAALAQEIAGGSSRWIETDVEVTSDATARSDVDLPTGALLAVEALSSDPERASQVEFSLVWGEHAFANADELMTAIKSPVGKDHRWMMFGGMHADHVMQFHDLRDGTATVCVHMKTNERETVDFGCQTLELANDRPVHELAFDFRQR